MIQSDRKPYVFISHASGDVKIAREIVANLRQHGITTWMAPDDVQPGREFSIQLEEAIGGCQAFVVLMSDKANASAFVRAETELAFGSRDIFPVRIADVQPAGGLALFLRLKHWTDAFGPEREANLTRLADTIKRMSVADEEPEPEPEPQPEPERLPRPKPRTLLIVAEPDPARPLSEEEATRAYIGDKAPHFLEKWRRMDASKSIVSFSFPGFLFGPFWLFYRKIFKEGMLVAAAAFVMSAFGIFGQVMDEKVIQVLVNVVSLGAALAIGLFGNHLYRRHVATQTALLDVAGQSPQAVRDRLAMQGGTSPGAALGLVAALFVANLIVFGLAKTCCSRPIAVPYEYPPTPSSESSLAPVASETAARDLFTGESAASPSPSPATAIWSVCYENTTSFEITFTINPNTLGPTQKTLAAGQSIIWTLQNSDYPQVRFDTDATSGTNLVVKTTATMSVATADQCGLTYRFTSNGDTVSLM